MRSAGPVLRGGGLSTVPAGPHTSNGMHPMAGGRGRLPRGGIPWITGHGSWCSKGRGIRRIASKHTGVNGGTPCGSGSRPMEGRGTCRSRGSAVGRGLLCQSSRNNTTQPPPPPGTSRGQLQGGGTSSGEQAGLGGGAMPPGGGGQVTREKRSQTVSALRSKRRVDGRSKIRRHNSPAGGEPRNK